MTVLGGIAIHPSATGNSGLEHPALHSPAARPRRGLRRALWGPCGALLLAAAAMLCLGTEALRAGLQEGIHYAVPVAAGFGLALLTVHRQAALGEWLRRLLKQRSALYWIVSVPAACQLLLIVLVQTVPESDWAGYWFSASHLRDHGEYVCLLRDGLVFRAHKPPGMAVYLAGLIGLFGPSVMAAQCVNVGLTLLGNLIFYDIMRRHLRREAALAATALLAWWPSRSFAVALLSYDAPGSLMILLMWWLLDHPRRNARRCLCAGVTAGLAAMLRITALLLPAAYLLYAMILPGRCKMRIRDGVALGAGLAVVMAAWGIRNHHVLGRVVVTSTQKGPSLYRGFHPLAGRYYTNAGWETLLAESGGDELKTQDIAWQRGGHFILSDPPAALFRMVRKWHRLLESDHEVAGLVFDSPAGPLPPAMYQHGRSVACGFSDMWYAWLVMCALLAGVQSFRGGDAMPALLWPIAALGTLILACGLFESQPRYMVMYHCFWAFIIAGSIRGWIAPSAGRVAGPCN